MAKGAGAGPGKGLGRKAGQSTNGLWPEGRKATINPEGDGRGRVRFRA